MKYLRVIQRTTQEVVEKIDITNETENGVDQIRAGLMQQIDRRGFRIDDYDDDDIDLELTIDNFYEDGTEVQTVVQTRVPPPPPVHDDQTDWEYDCIFECTGTGKPEGNSGYFVLVTHSSNPELIPVGTTYEFV